MSEFHTNTDARKTAEEASAVSSTPQKNNSFEKGFLEQLELVVIAFAVILLIFSFLGRTCRVSGPSMENTLYDGETLIISNLFYTPERSDIIVFHQTGDNYNEPIVKRVIGVPGDTVKIEYFTGKMVVTVTDAQGNSNVLNEDYIKYSGTRYVNSTTYVEDGTLFVMGDNRSFSADSRAADIGLVDQRRVLGRVIFRLTPFSKFGKVA